MSRKPNNPFLSQTASDPRINRQQLLNKPDASTVNYDTDFDNLVQETLQVQQTSRDTVQSALEQAQQTELLAANNLTRLKSQGDQLKRVDKQLDTTSTSVDHAKKQTSYLSKLASRPFFIPVFGKDPNKSKKNSKQPDVPSTTSTPTASTTTRSSIPSASPAAESSLYGPRTSSLTTPPSAVSSFASQHDQDTSRALEQEIDTGLTSLSLSVSAIKHMSLAMQDELQDQHQHIQQVQDKVDVENERLNVINKKLNRIK